jgi:ABC-type nickel/cobalt efflux system permease component RcnA
MGVFDIILMILILGVAFWLLYRSLWKKQGHCQGCEGGSCSGKKR